MNTQQQTTIAGKDHPPVSEAERDRSRLLPLFASLSNDQQDDIIDQLRGPAARPDSMSGAA